MRGEQNGRTGPEAHLGDTETEDWVRELLAENAYAIQPPRIPYPAIKRRGLAERRRRLAVAGAVLVALGAVPVGMSLVEGRQGIDTAVVEPTVNAAPSPAPSRTPSPAPADTPARPATDGQLLDGITFAEAADGLRKCIAFDRQGVGPPGDEGLGSPAEYRILLAMRSTGDSNVPGDGVFVVAVRDAPRPARLICTLRDGEARGVNASGGGPEETSHPLTPDPNAGRLYQQSFLDRGRWKLPFRWGTIGTLTPGVTRVTAEYGGSAPVEATLDHGWFVATGTLLRQTTRAPHLKGYDSRGTLVYDSDEDETYQSTLP